MAEIVLVHGIGQEQESADSLEKSWLPALAGGVRTAGLPEIADRIWREQGKPGGIEARMAFYGHLFLRAGQQGADPGELTSEEGEFAEQLAQEWLGRAATQASRARDREAASRERAFVRHEIGKEEAGVGEMVRLAIKGLSRVPWFAPTGFAFAERFVKRALAQVARYLGDDETRSKAIGTVLELVDDKTKAIVGHSLGSVVAFEAAHQLDQAVPLLVTLGSPLGLNSVVYQKLRPQPPTFPGPVKRWVNVADRDDFIAVEPDLSALFATGLPPEATFEGGYTVDNGAEPHRADFYLTKQEVGEPLGRVL